MWLTVFVMALAVSTEPFRLGMTVLLLNRRRPVADLLAFLCGGFVMGITVGLVVLFGLRSAVDSAHFTLPKVQIGMGLVALILAAVVAVVRLPGRDADGEPGRLARQARRLVNAEGPWIAGAAGLGIALPSVDFLAVLAVILASEATAGQQVGALVMFTVVAFALVEIPLIAYLFAPDPTRAAMARLNLWFARRRRVALSATLAVIGTILLTVGLVTL
ncbi:MAG: GAP family protein [Mycobacterium sp.]|nr:GAP family protein [Mycobacterium sp.]